MDRVESKNIGPWSYKPNFQLTSKLWNSNETIAKITRYTGVGLAVVAIAETISELVKIPLKLVGNLFGLYKYSIFHFNLFNSKPTILDIEVGASNRFIDGVRNVLSISNKIKFWHLKVNSGNISDKTINMTKKYLADNNLSDVQVSVNQYKPQMIWKRIFTNPKTSLISKLTLGVITGLGYTLTVSKLTGFFGDYYDPSSNTISLSSDIPALALHECARAKDYNSRKHPSLHVLSEMSNNGVYQSYSASSDIIKHLKANYSSTEVKNAYKILVPSVSLSIAGIISLVGGYSKLGKYLLMIPIAGHVAGRILASREQDTDKKSDRLTQPV